MTEHARLKKWLRADAADLLALLALLAVPTAVMYLVVALVPPGINTLSDHCRADPSSCDRGVAVVDTSYRQVLAENRKACVSAASTGLLNLGEFKEFCRQHTDVLANAEALKHPALYREAAVLKPEIQRLIRAQEQLQQGGQ